ncbi:MAG TPA: UDP-2,4-diacetamido-2,4,6-trideoxy-beta-L-altropyranose hydrolase [Vicinamibacterales bacterium]|nr:UDP-2,4-diacetamido-2,4,6-trideoxy-beta-L-altropyranose hydrolase [Vicinamibacterales bacterium]
MRVVIRADADDRIGGGHFVRCAALASALHALGAHVTLATTPVLPALTADLDPGVIVLPLPARHPDPRDLASVLELLSDADWVVVDGYYFDAAYRRALSDSQARVAVIDDLADQGPYTEDLVVNQGPGAWHLPYEGTRETRFLLGLSFALLRPEFTASSGAAHPKVRHQTEGLRLLVTMGGSDPANRTGVVLGALEQLGDRRLRTTVVIGAANAHADILRVHIGQMALAGHQIQAVTADGRKMADLMNGADLSVSNAGGTLWELACCGVAPIAELAAANQALNGQLASQLGLAVVLDGVPTRDALADAIATVSAGDALRERLARRGRARVDGRGSERVARAIVAGARDWSIRPVTPADVEAIWQINSDPTVRAMSHSTEPIPFEQHEQWYERTLADKDRCLFVAERDGMVAGLIRYDRDADHALVSLAIAAAYRSRGLATRLFISTFRAACTTLGVTLVEALVFDENPGSARALFKAGYSDAGTREVRGRRCRVISRRLEG